MNLLNSKTVWLGSLQKALKTIELLTERITALESK